MLLLTLVSCVIIGLCVSNQKLLKRIKSIFNKTSEKLSDKLGDVRDDREIAIQERKTKNKQLEEQLIQVKTEINLTKIKQQNSVRDAEKYGVVAKTALSQNNEDAARIAIGQKQINEELAIKLLNSIKGLESRFVQLKDLLNQSKGEVDEAISNTEIFKTEYVAYQLEKEMLEAENSFGGLGKMDFGQSEEELTRMKSELEARREMTGVLKSVESSEKSNKIEEELRKMKV